MPDEFFPDLGNGSQPSYASPMLPPSLRAVPLLVLAACVEYAVEPRDRVDYFRQDDLNAVDLLFVVDNSLSMVEEQAHLAENFQVLIATFEAADVDWRLAVTTTETQLPTYRGRLAGRDDEILLSDADGNVLAETAWDAGRAWTTDKAWQLDPEALADDPEAWATAWCEAPLPFDGGMGSPGAWNPTCDGLAWEAPVPGTDRGPRAPAWGDIAITEVQALTSLGDSTCEWVELANLTADTLDLGGLRLGDMGADDAPLARGTHLDPYDLLVIGRSEDAPGACGVPVDVALADGIVLADGTVWVEATTPDAEERFADLVAVGTESLGLEMGLEAALLALSDPWLTDDNGSFVRDGASLSVVFVSDEDDLSPDPVAAYVNGLKASKGQDGYRVPGRVNLVAVAGVDDPPTPGAPSCVGENGEAAWGVRYLTAAEQTGGPALSICDDFYEVVTTLGLTDSGLRTDFALSAPPDLDTLEVTLFASDAPDALSWDLTAGTDFALTLEEPPDDDPVVHLAFDGDQVPQAGTVVVARYDLLAESADIHTWFPTAR